jgi:hypothetical protein
MADWYPPERPQSHRAPTGARGVITRLAAPVTAVVVVVAVILLLIWINGRSGDGSGKPVGAGPASHQPLPTPDGSPTATHRSPSPSPSHHHHQAAPRKTHPAAPSPSESSPAITAAFAPVEVLNNSRIHGLAHHVAAEVEGRGWTISQIGNLRGRVAETTLYYPPGGFDAAEHLAHDFGQIQRLEPQSEGGLSSTSLVLVVTRFWTG